MKPKAKTNAEKIIVDMLQSYLQEQSPEPLKALQGISYLEAGRFIQKPQIRKNLPLEETPLPAWDKIDLTP